MVDEAGNAITLKFMQEAFADWKKDVDRRFDDVLTELRQVRAGQNEQTPITVELRHRVGENEKDLAELKRLREEDLKTSTSTKLGIGTAVAVAVASWVPDLIQAIGG